VSAMRYVRIAIVVALVTSATAQPNDAANRSELVHLNLDSCVSLPSDKRSWLPKEWQPFKPFVKLCPVGMSNVPGLYVMSVWADDFYLSQPAGSPAVRFPKPVLFRPDGKGVGEFPVGFPRDPPRTLDPIFIKWSGNFPHEIKLWLQDPAVLGDRYLPPLVWNEKTGRFSQKAGKKGAAHGTGSGH